MSSIMCYLCDECRDSDEDCDGFYTNEYPDEFICKHCRDAYNLTSSLDEPANV